MVMPAITTTPAGTNTGIAGASAGIAGARADIAGPICGAAVVTAAIAKATTPGN